MARGRENARLARALERSQEGVDQVGQMLVLGFGGPVRLLTFITNGRTIRVRDTDTNRERRISAALVWKLARVCLPAARGGAE
jgi:hypothetical protein